MHLHCMTSGANFGAIMASDATALDMTALNVIDHALPRFGCVLTRVTLPHTVWPSWHQLLDSEVQVWEQLGLELFLLVKSRFVDHQSISCETLFVTLWTRESRRADMFCLHMILNMRNLLWVVSTLGTLPRTTIILEHEVVHQDVQTLYCFSIGSYIKMVTFIWSILNMNISVNGLFELKLFLLVIHHSVSSGTMFVANNTRKTRSWNMFSLNVVLHMGNLPRVVLTFFALPAAIVILEHEIFHQYVQILDSVSMGTFKKIYWSTLCIPYIMLPVLMGHKGVACWAELLADRTFKARSLHVFGLNVPGECCAVLCTIITFTAIPQTIRTLGHLVFDRRNQLLWTRFKVY